jgi:hypothetical protein
VALRGRRLQGRRCRVQSGFLLGQSRLKILGLLFKRRVTQSFGTPAEPIALQACDLVPQPLDLGQRRAQNLPQGCWIVRQGRGDGERARTLNRRCESRQMELS